MIFIIFLWKTGKKLLVHYSKYNLFNNIYIYMFIILWRIEKNIPCQSTFLSSKYSVHMYPVYMFIKKHFWYMLDMHNPLVIKWTMNISLINKLNIWEWHFYEIATYWEESQLVLKDTWYHMHVSMSVQIRRISQRID